VPDQLIGEGLPRVLRQHRHEIALDLHRVGLAGEAEPRRQPRHVGVDDHADGGAERRRQDHVGGLAGDAGQGHQRVEIGRHLAAVALDQRPGHADQAPRLGAVEARLEDQRLERLGRRLGQRVGVGVPGEQRRRQRVDHLVGRLRGQDGRAQELEGVLVVELAGGVGPGRGQRRDQRGGLAGRRRHRGRGRPKAVTHEALAR
jgi:hypothetical protein